MLFRAHIVCFKNVYLNRAKSRLPLKIDHLTVLDLARSFPITFKLWTVQNYFDLKKNHIDELRLFLGYFYTYERWKK
jgi:hypothetical protein